MITLGPRSQAAMRGVHPDLIGVIKRAASIATPSQDFTVLEGVRTREKMCENWGKGRTAAECTAHGVAASYARPNEKKVTWLANPFNSNHAVKSDGYGHAVDLAPWPIDWNDAARFNDLARIVLASALEERVKIVWGGMWHSSPDLPHFELQS